MTALRCYECFEGCAHRHDIARSRGQELDHPDHDAATAYAEKMATAKRKKGYADVKPKAPASRPKVAAKRVPKKAKAKASAGVGAGSCAGAGAGAARTEYLECTTGTSDKFWKVTLTGEPCVVAWSGYEVVADSRGVHRL